MTETIQFELVSPEERLVSEPVHMAVIPGEEGQFGVAAKHTSLVANLKPGILRVYREKEGDAWNIFIAGGFADVTSESCVILAEEAMPVDTLDQDALEQQKSDLNEDFGMAEEEMDKNRIQRRIDLIDAKLEALRLISAA